MADKSIHKRIIACCDGTWQSSDRGDKSSPSNVARFSRMLASEGSGKPQLVYYQSGVGTSGSNSSSWLFNIFCLGYLIKWLAHVTEGMFGLGLEENVASAYHFISTNFTPGKCSDPDDHHNHMHKECQQDDDEIFLFGFSRGAFTTRALAGLITDMGLLRPEYMEHFSQCYDLYRRHGNAVTRDSKGHHVSFWKSVWEHGSYEDREFIRQLQRERWMHKANIKVVGVWDTVGARGIPDSWLSRISGINNRYNFHNTALSSRIEHAFQALALDEHRGAFKPTLWYLDPDFLKDSPEKAHDPKEGHSHYYEFEEQAPEKHSHGYKPRTSLDGKIVPNLKQCWFPGYHGSIGGGGSQGDWFSRDQTNTSDISLAWMCDQVDGLLEFDAKAVQHVLFRSDEAKYRCTSWAAGFNLDMMRIFFRLSLFGGDRLRTPGQYNKELQHGEQGYRDFITNETMHPSIKHRIDVFQNVFPLFDYFPQALSDRTGWLNPFHHKLSPRWTWKESQEHGQTDGRGACWIRPSIPDYSGWIWSQERERKIYLSEWIIRDLHDPRRHNFEYNLLPAPVREKLDARNKKIVLGLQDDKNPYWTRTVFDVKPQHGRTNGHHHQPNLIGERWYVRADPEVNILVKDIPTMLEHNELHEMPMTRKRSKGGTEHSELLHEHWVQTKKGKGGDGNGAEKRQNGLGGHHMKNSLAPAVQPV